MTTTQLQRNEHRPKRSEDGTKPIQERNELIERELGLAEQIAADYRQRGIDRDDLRQIALLGLVKAAERFDESRGTRFPVFASLTINGEIKRHFRDHGWSVRPPRSVQEAYLNVRRAEERLAQELGRQPTVAELSDDTGLDAERVRAGIAAHGSYRARTLDDSPGDDGPVRSLELSSIERGYDRVHDQVEVSLLTGTLSDRDMKILRLRFWEGLTQSDIAARLGVSQVQVSRLLRSIATTLRDRARRSNL